MPKSELMRTSMYAGGTSPVKMIQAGFYNEDCLVYDLEDSVSAGEKDAARFLVYNAVKYQRPKDKYILIRVNGIYSRELDEDLEAAVRAQPDAIRIPKVEYAEEVQRIDAKMTAIEEKAGLPVGGIKLWCNIESYLGVINAQAIATASTRVAAMALGAEDFTASMSAQRTKPGWEIFYARNAILMACRAAGELLSATHETLVRETQRALDDARNHSLRGGSGMISTQESTALVLSLLPEDEALHVLLSVNGGNRRWCAMPEDGIINRDIRVWDTVIVRTKADGGIEILRVVLEERPPMSLPWRKGGKA